ncbi:MAG: nucleotidyltransferase domain-containing protein [Thermoplasmata archaeon]
MTADGMAHCYRCGYSWFPRRTLVRICSRCKSPYFDVPKLRTPTYGGGLGIAEVIGPKRTVIISLARRYGATNVRVFGSVARKQATPASDIDLLVDPVGNRYRPIDLGIALRKALGRSVDVVTEAALPWLIQPNVVAEAIPL